MATRKPVTLWAQRSDKLFLTFDLQEVERPQIKVENKDDAGYIYFKGKAESHATGTDSHQYELELPLYGKVDADNSQISVTARHIVLVVPKVAESEGHWPRLTKDKTKQPNLKVDWDKWVDEDDEDESSADPTSQFDLSNLSDMSNFESQMGASGDNEDSDDEEIPDLEMA